MCRVLSQIEMARQGEILVARIGQSEQGQAFTLQSDQVSDRVVIGISEPAEPAGSSLELTHFAIESASYRYFPACVARRQAKLPDHHPENLKLSFRAYDRIGLVLRLQHDQAVDGVTVL